VSAADLPEAIAPLRPMSAGPGAAKAPSSALLVGILALAAVLVGGGSVGKDFLGEPEIGDVGAPRDRLLLGGGVGDRLLELVGDQVAQRQVLALRALDREREPAALLVDLRSEDRS